MAPIHRHTVLKNTALTQAFHSKSNQWLKNNKKIAKLSSQNFSTKRLWKIPRVTFRMMINAVILGSMCNF